MRSSSVLTILRQAFIIILLLLGSPLEAEAQVQVQDPDGNASTTSRSDSGSNSAQVPDETSQEEKSRLRSRVRKGIDVITIQGRESEAAGDFKTGDSVAAFDAADLEALGAQSVADIAAFTPNLEIVTTGATTPTFFIRGVGLNDFNANSTSAVAIYQDEVQLNSPALQLGSLFDIGQVTVLRGPQGTGAARSASAGAIKWYSKKPSGEYGASLRVDFGKYNYRDYEGMIEAPLLRDILAARFAFRFSERDGYLTNNCGNAPARTNPNPNMGPIIGPDGTAGRGQATNKGDANGDLIDIIQRTVATDVDGEIVDLPLSICGEFVPLRKFTNGIPNPASSNPTGYSSVPEGLPSKVNNLHNWAMRGSLLFRPTLDQEWLLTGRYSSRDEMARLGQSIGVGGGLFDRDTGVDLEQLGSLGQTDGQGYRAEEIIARELELNRCRLNDDSGEVPECAFDPNDNKKVKLAKAKLRNQADYDAFVQLAEELANLDSKPHTGDFNLVGPTTNDVWGVSLRGLVALGRSFDLTWVSSYDVYARRNFVDLDMSPNVIFEIDTIDEGWQAYQNIDLAGDLFEKSPLHWNLGVYMLAEELDVHIENHFPAGAQQFAISARDYVQSLYSAAGYGSFAWDLSKLFTLDGGMRYNWEVKEMDYRLTTGVGASEKVAKEIQKETWQDPTGTVRLTYKFRENTHAFMKYTRGWKGGHFNATSSTAGVFAADPETIDSFEVGMVGSWFEGHLNARFSLFHYNYSNYQIFTTDQPLGGQPEFVVINANDAEVYGAEIELGARTDSGLLVSVGAGWLQSEFLDFVQKKTVQLQRGNAVEILDVEIQNSGNRLLNSPKWKVALTVMQNVKLGRYGQITARWDGAWTHDIFFDPTGGRGAPSIHGDQFFPKNAIGQSAYWLHNIRLTYTTPNGLIEVALWVRNVGDQVYKNFAFDGAAISELSIYYVGMPRTQGISLTSRF